MALEKIISVDQIEVVEDGSIQVRTATKIVDDGVVINKSFHRHIIVPGQDYSQENDRVKAICAAIHTSEVIANYQAMSAAMAEANKSKVEA